MKILSNLFQKKITSIDRRINFNDYLLFIHIPKNGGTSVLNSLGLTKGSHIKAKEILNGNNASFLKKKYCFGVVRNPFERFISLYHYARMETSYYHNNLKPEDSIHGKHMDYELLKNTSLSECAILLKKGQLQHDAAWNHWDPQFTWLYDRKGRKSLVDKEYRLENLKELEIDFQDKFNISIEIPFLNTSIKSDYRKVIDNKTRSILEEFYHMDLTLFNYKF